MKQWRGITRSRALAAECARLRNMRTFRGLTPVAACGKRAPFERNAIVLREGKPFLAMRYFEADPNRRPVLNSTQQLEARAADDERMAFGGLCVLLGGIAGLAACWLWIFSIPKQPAP